MVMNIRTKGNKGKDKDTALTQPHRPHTVAAAELCSTDRASIQSMPQPKPTLKNFGLQPSIAKSAF